MKTSIIVLALGLLTASYFIMTPSVDSVETEFQQFLGEYGRNYFSEHEYAMRLQVFRENYQTIQRVNSEGRSYTLGVNKFADWTNQEYKNYLTYRESDKTGVEYATLKGQFDDEVDWRDSPTLNPIQDQGSCGSCYAFAALAGIEHETYYFKPSLQKYSEQQIVDCSRDYGNEGCNGGLMTNVYEYLRDFPICIEQEYPYIGKESDSCAESSCVTVDDVIRKYAQIPENSADALKEIATYSVPAIGIDAGSKEFQMYRSGVFDFEECTTNLNHAVAIVGYGHDADADKDFFIIRNSWTEGWGESGYMRIAIGNEDNGGTCGFLKDMSYIQYRC